MLELERIPSDATTSGARLENLESAVRRTAALAALAGACCGDPEVRCVCMELCRQLEHGASKLSAALLWSCSSQGCGDVASVKSQASQDRDR